MYSLSAKSTYRLSLVHPKLADIVRLAISMTAQDFIVLEGLRCEADEAKAIKSGCSKTAHSLHLKQADGFAHAVDLVPFVIGEPVWDWKRIYPVARAMQMAAKVKCVTIRWGGVWDRHLADLPTLDAGLAQAVADYAARHPGPDLLDGPHYELVM